MDTRLPPTDDPDLATIVGSFNAMVDTLKLRIERDSRFAGDVSHELRSPLTTLVAAVAVMEQRRSELPLRHQRALDLVSAELDRFHQMLESLLSLARAEAGLDRDQLVPLSVASLVTHALARAGVGVHVVHSSGSDEVAGDKALLERAFFNLIVNAQRHGQGLTDIRVEEADGQVVTFVDDNGPGVPAGERERVFERFATNRAARGSSSGTGLGLALVAQAVTAHGGAVWCTGRDGPGARFVVSLPAYEAP